MVKKTQSKSEQPKRPNEALKYTGMASKMGVIIGLGVYGGIKLDERSSREFPLWTLVLSLVSVVLAVYQVIRTTSR